MTCHLTYTTFFKTYIKIFQISRLSSRYQIHLIITQIFFFLCQDWAMTRASVWHKLAMCNWHLYCVGTDCNILELLPALKLPPVSILVQHLKIKFLDESYNIPRPKWKATVKINMDINKNTIWKMLTVCLSFYISVQVLLSYVHSMGIHMLGQGALPPGFSI